MDGVTIKLNQRRRTNDLIHHLCPDRWGRDIKWKGRLVGSIKKRIINNGNIYNVNVVSIFL